jgi:hypothetical protein
MLMTERLRGRARRTAVRVEEAVLRFVAVRRQALSDRGDVPGWVLVTLMTAGLVLTLWAVAGPRLTDVFNTAMDNVVGGP